ncbi:MAG TPA: septation protein SepH [Streptosporangiaceae bacterium]|jgi:hypothetical protein
MQELRLVAVSEDGTYLVMATVGRGTRFTLPIDDRLRAAVRGNFSRLGQYEIEVESPLRPKEIQARIRAGETAEEIAEAAGIPLERVRWFEGPVLQEREFIAQQALRVGVRRAGEGTPGPALGDLVRDRLGHRAVDPEEAEWDSWKCDDGTWRVRLSFIKSGRHHTAHWVYDQRRRHVIAYDDDAARLCSDDPADFEALDADDSTPMATVTPFVPRLATPPPAEPPAREPTPAPAPPAIPPAAPQATPQATPAATPPAAQQPPAPRPQPVPPPVPQPEPGPYHPAEAPAAYESGPYRPATQEPAPQLPAPAAPEPAPQLPAEAPAAQEAAPHLPAEQEPVPYQPAPEPERVQEPPRPEPTAPPAAQAPPQAPAPAPAPEAPGIDAPAAAPSADAPAAQAPAAPPAAEAPVREPARDEPAAVQTELGDTGGQADTEPEAAPAARAAKPKQARPAKRASGRREMPPADPPAAPVEQVEEPAASGDTVAPAPARRTRKGGRGRRASVPSWDEIMFGARKPD